MNRAIRRVMGFAVVLVLLLLANLTWVQVFQRETYADNALNKRQFLEDKQIHRGQISAGGLVLARSEDDGDGYYSRVYESDPQAYGPVLGYLSDTYGTAGLEASQNRILNGSDPSLFAARAFDAIAGRGTAGANVELTIDPEAQKVAYDQLSANGYVGSIVAIRPSTGEILAMASTPSYDPNPIARGDGEAWSALNSDDRSPLLNHATQVPLPPGSTFKLLTTIAALEQQRTPDTPVRGAASVTLPNTETTLENYGGRACNGVDGDVPLRIAFAHSCNTAFAVLADEIGKEPLEDVATRFHVGETFDDLGVPQVASTLGEIPDRAALAQTAIGQRDVSFTPLQSAMITAAIANGGTLMEPHLVKSVLGQDMSELTTIDPDEIGQAIDPETARIMTELMRGSEQQSGGEPGSIVSKTGTAEHGAVRGELAPHVWYTAFAPDSDVAVSVVVENGGTMGSQATGAKVSGPLGRAVIHAVERSGR